MIATSNSYEDIRVLSLLGIAFVVLKLCEVIDWPWRWVLAPFWIQLLIISLAFLLAGCCLLLAYLFDKPKGTP